MRFREMNISSSTLAALESLNFMQPTEVQEKVIPIILEGREVIVRSQTGTGKTAAFGVGLIEHIARNRNKKALVLAPTRELAIQITKDLRAIATNHKLRIFVIYGGEDIERQLQLIRRGYEIIVATPGRLLDHYRRGSIELSHFNLVVLDEADRMLDMGFKEDIDAILSKVSHVRQMMLFSATINQEIKSMSGEYMHDPEVVEIGPLEKIGVIEEEFIKVNRRDKFDLLKKILHQEPNARILIFVATQRATEYLGHKLLDSGIEAGYLHGGMKQSRRERIVRDFREGAFSILVATDVASRGLHIEEISHIINYDEAKDKETHIHRIGRTGRMGKKGKAITFVELDRVDRPRHTFHSREPRRTQRTRMGFSYRRR